MVGHPRHQPCRPALLSCFLRAYCHAVVAVVSGMGIVCFVFRIHSVIQPVGNHRRTKGRKGGCSACHAVRILCWTLATVRHGTRLVLRWHIIRVWCPHSVCLSCGNCRRLDIMGVGQQDTIHIPPVRKCRVCTEVRLLVRVVSIPSLLKLSMSFPMVLRLQPMYSASSTS